jgi:hypothetical protein
MSSGMAYLAVVALAALLLLSGMVVLSGRNEHADPAQLEAGFRHARCVDSYSNIELRIYERLNGDSQSDLIAQECGVQHRVLGQLRSEPAPVRDAYVKKLFDVAAIDRSGRANPNRGD